ncbi:DUF3077 domain-containing protein [Pseudomonas prosekii]|uniref:DUF3077 domain-containing protein n=1 Tax=Pseudomonas prosekii TaxID=1148509 RepID=A0A1H1TID3_9PSED|nr:DUF3077 domain-containing protein [Pseudomonas prosekii]SDS59954.1 Protein of unknown function [Pseudomonas prosekii]
MKHLTTTEVRFISPAHAHKKQELFSVNPNVDAQNALHIASDLLASVMDSLADAASGEIPLEGNNAFMVTHTVESARAALNSVLWKLEINDLNSGA